MVNTMHNTPSRPGKASLTLLVITTDAGGHFTRAVAMSRGARLQRRRRQHRTSDPGIAPTLLMASGALADGRTDVYLPQ